MPRFDFKCDDCQHVFERAMKMSQRNLNAACPQCGGVSKRMVSAPAFVIDGYNAANGYSEDK